MRRRFAALTVVPVLLLTGAIAAVPAEAATSGCPTTATIRGTSGNDVLRGTRGADIICGLGGNDKINGGAGDDRIYGNTGKDVIYGEAGADSVYGGPGADKIYGGSGNDNIFGDELATASQPKSGNNDDVVYLGAGSDSGHGGPGDDALFSGGSVAKRGGDNMWGDSGDDVLVGTGATWGDVYYGGDGNDYLNPPAARLSPLGNNVHSGNGNDVAVLFNWLQDAASLSSSSKIPLTSACSVKVPLPSSARAGDTGKVQCKLPYPKKYTGLSQILNLSVTVDADGDYSYTGSVAKGFASLTVDQLDGMTHYQAKLGKDVCICDPTNVDWRLPHDLLLG